MPRLWQAQIDWGGAQVGGLLRWRWGDDPWQQDTLSLDHGRREALAGWLARVLPHLGERFLITTIGHRIVHGGERFHQSQWIRQDQLAALRALIPLAPLHNKPALDTVELLLTLCPHIPQAGVFDTATTPFPKRPPPTACPWHGGTRAFAATASTASATATWPAAWPPPRPIRICGW